MRAKNNITFRLFLLILPLVLCTVAFGKIIYVDDSATGANNGTSWDNAYVYLQEALADANDSEKPALSLSNVPVEIRVAQGIYKPDQGANQVAGDREATFRLIKGVILKGGYAGSNGPDPNVVNIKLYKTILSGDLNSNDIDVNDLSDFTNEPTRAENSYNVVTGSGTDETAVIDGFIITCGNANGPLTPAPIGKVIYNDLSNPTLSNSTIPTYREKLIYGGGMYNECNSSRITNCTFVNNSASSRGGGIYNSVSFSKLINCMFSNNSAGYRDGPQGSGGGICNEGGEPILINCTFTKNRAEHWGGGMSNGYKSIPTLTNCTFSSNTAISGGGICNGYKTVPKLTNCTFNGNWGDFGGGMYNGSDSSPMINRCMFTGNWVTNKGEAMYNLESNPTLDNCIFIFNGNLNPVDTRESYRSGECIYNYDNNNLTLTNCTFAENSGGTGSAFRCNSYLYPSKVRLTNCILWDGGEEILNENGSTIIVTYSNVQGGWEGDGNIDVDPQFVNHGCWRGDNGPNIGVEPNYPNLDWVDGDYHLKSQAGRYDPNSGSWIVDDVTSLCIDAGDPNSPVGDEPEPNGSRINMGAYGGTSEASMSVSSLSR